jgi:hypothetical protein
MQKTRGDILHKCHIKAWGLEKIIPDVSSVGQGVRNHILYSAQSIFSKSQPLECHATKKIP